METTQDELIKRRLPQEKVPSRILRWKQRQSGRTYRLNCPAELMTTNGMQGSRLKKVAPAVKRDKQTRSGNTRAFSLIHIEDGNTKQITPLQSPDPVMIGSR